MKLDERGNVYVTGPKGVWIFAPDGEHLGVIEVPENVGNVNWGGDDWQHAVHPGLDLGLPRAHEGRRQQARLHEIGGPTVDSIDPKSAALVIQDLQNDVIIDGGAFADSGAPAHATSQNVVANVKGLAAACRKAGVPVIHVWYIVEAGRARPEAERAALRGRQGRERARPRHAGAPRPPTGSSRRTATTSSRRCG